MIKVYPCGDAGGADRWGQLLRSKNQGVARFSDMLNRKISQIELWEDSAGFIEAVCFTVVKEECIEACFCMYHAQDCCESVYLESTSGDWADLLESPIVRAEEAVSSGDSSTWTFYKLDTCKGSITMRWFGESNGYYSESVDCFTSSIRMYA